MAIPNVKTVQTKRLVFVDAESGTGTSLTLDNLLEVMNGAEGSDLINLGDSILTAAAAASDETRLAMLASYAALDPQDKSIAFGNYLEGFVNPLEHVKRDIDGKVIGEGFGGASREEALTGETSSPLLDWESLRDLDVFDDVSGDISGGALEIDFMVTPTALVEYNDDLALSFTELPAAMVGISYVFRVQYKNTDGSAHDVTPTLSGSGLATVVAMAGVDAAVTIDAGDTVLFLAAIADDGSLQLSVSTPA